MDGRQVRDIVSVLAGLRFPPGIHLAGGEAFLVPELLEEGTTAVRDAGLEMDFIETNAAWVRDEESAVRRLHTLRRAGCPRLLVSSTPFHAETIPPWRVDVAMVAARRVFGPGGALLYTPEFHRQLTVIDRDATIPFETYLQHVGMGLASQTMFQQFPMTLAGRAATGLDPVVPRVPAHQLHRRSCAAQLLGSAQAHIDPDGSHLPGYCTGIVLGTIDEIPQLVTDGLPVAGHPIVGLLCEQGIDGLLEMATTDHGFVPDEAGYSGPCHLCQAIRGHLLARGVGVSELGPRGFYEDLGLLG